MTGGRPGAVPPGHLLGGDGELGPAWTSSPARPLALLAGRVPVRRTCSPAVPGSRAAVLDENSGWGSQKSGLFRSRSVTCVFSETRKSRWQLRVI